MKRVLIVGSGSFIGNSVAAWLGQYPEQYIIDIVDAIGDKWKSVDFSRYDVVYQVAGIAHVAKETPEMRDLFFNVNAKMSGEIAAAAKAAGVKQYIFMSTKGVYPAFVPTIDKNTQVNPPKLYGQSKLEGEKNVFALQSEHFKVSVLRPPAVYGIGAPGSFDRLLRKIPKMKVFPAYKNKRSMIYIDNLCEFIKIVIDRELDGVLVPQDAEYVSTSDIVRYASKAMGKNVYMLKCTSLIIPLLVKATYKFRKPFGNTVYKHDFNINDRDYYVVGLKDAIENTIKAEKINQ